MGKFFDIFNVSCIGMILFFGVILFKCVQTNTDMDITLGYSFLTLIHILALIFINRK